jgi:hypothetical protein
VRRSEKQKKDEDDTPHHQKGAREGQRRNVVEDTAQSDVSAFISTLATGSISRRRSIVPL